MPYLYDLKLELATTHKKFNLTDKRGVIDNAIQRYNNRSHEMQNPKTLKLQDINHDSIF